MAFYSLEPFGGDTSYIGHAITAATVANVNRPKGKLAYKVEDFMPEFGKKAQSIEEMLQIAQMFTIGLGGQDKRDLDPAEGD